MIMRTAEMWTLLNTAMGEVETLKKLVGRGLSEDAFENFDKLIGTLMTIRDIAGRIAEVEGCSVEQATSLWLLQDGVTKEILRLTDVSTMSAAAGR